jgi:hypothetical protein
MTTIRGLDFPDELFYLLEHDAWARLDADGKAPPLQTRRSWIQILPAAPIFKGLFPVT